MRPSGAGSLHGVFEMVQQIALALALAGGSDGLDSVDPIDWKQDLAAARDEAKLTKKPLLVVFRCER